MKKLKKTLSLSLALAIILILAVPVFAAGKGVMQDINVLVGGINIYVDGVLQEPKNANGEAVDPIIWNGTTYLPVRALTNMLTDKEVGWEQSTMSVYIGKRPTVPGTTLDKLSMYGPNSSSSGMYTGKDAAFSKVDKKVEPYSRLLLGSDGGYATYILDSKYTQLNGKLDIAYERIGAKWATGVAFYSVDSYGTENLIKTYYVQAGDQPVDVSVPLTGVSTLKIVSLYNRSADWPYSSDYSSRPAQLYNITLDGY